MNTNDNDNEEFKAMIDFATELQANMIQKGGMGPSVHAPAKLIIPKDVTDENALGTFIRQYVITELFTDPLSTQISPVELKSVHITIENSLKVTEGQARTLLHKWVDELA